MLLQAYDSYDKSKLEGISEENVQTKVRLTALMTLGTRSTHELQFAEVQKALGLASDSEVEAWVVRAIGKVCTAVFSMLYEHQPDFPAGQVPRRYKKPSAEPMATREHSI